MFVAPEIANLKMVIYMIRRKKTGKLYIGKTTRKLKLRIRQHVYYASKSPTNSYIDNAIGEHGVDEFEVLLVEECSSKEELNEREKYWIKFFNSKSPNGYNLTDGGDGGAGRPISEKQRQIISESNKGKVLSDITKTKISDSKGVPVVCVDTGDIFKSITAAAEWAGVALPSISAALHHKRHTSGGYRWNFVDNPNETEITPQNRKRRVVCIETGEIFESITAASEWAGKNVHEALRGRNKTAGGYHWQYTDPPSEAESAKKPYRQSVICLETGEIFESVRAAAKFAGISPCTVGDALHKRRLTAGGYHWEYVDAEK